MTVAEGHFQALPVPDADSKPFWDACAHHELALQHCADCGQIRFPPAPICWRCRSWAYEWRPHPGSASLYSWVVVHHPIPPSIAPLVPYIVALVELEPAVKMPTRLVDLEPDAVEAGMALEVVFEDVADGIALPLFRPAASAPDPGSRE